MKELFKVTNEGATDASLEALVSGVGELPPAYIQFLRESNGAELGVTDTGGDCLVLWSAEEISANNCEYKIQEYLPACVAIGSDGGGMAILLQRSGQGLHG